MEQKGVDQESADVKDTVKKTVVQNNKRSEPRDKGMVSEKTDDGQDRYDPWRDLEYYKFPQISLLNHYENSNASVDKAEQKANEDRIINSLRNFGVEISGITATGSRRSGIASATRPSCRMRQATGSTRRRSTSCRNINISQTATNRS